MTSASLTTAQEDTVACLRSSNKRLIVRCDGTWNDSISTDSPLTNVARISRCIPGVSDNGVVQVVSYWSGVGSGTTKGGNIVDGMTGRGISANIRDAYSFLCHNYLRDNQNQDEIVLIGFSRGAFTVRSIASLIADVGLLEKPGLSYMIKLFKLWANQLSKRRKKDEMFPDMPPSTPYLRMRRLCKTLEDMKLLRIGVKVKVCAVWDTVGSLGLPVPGPIPQRVSKRLAFINSTLSETIENAVQALALNERRKHFQPTVWKANSKTKLSQCWFLGAHSDVGGGNEDTGLANLALIWMITRLSDFVYFDHEALYHLASHRRIGERYKKLTRSKEFTVNVNLEGLVKMGIHYNIKRQHSGLYGRAAGKIQNSARGLFLLAGIVPRKPGQFLINAKGLYRNSKDNPSMTSESMHWTVRVLLGLNLRKCPALLKYHTKIVDGSGVVWILQSSTRHKNETSVRLSEDEFSDLERSLLQGWATAEGYTKDRAGTEPESETESPTGTVKRYLSDILIPLLAETQVPKIGFPPQDADQEARKTLSHQIGKPRRYL